MSTPTYQTNVIKERHDLITKLISLRCFFDTETYRGLPLEDQKLLDKQADVMSEYSTILYLRIARFNGVPE